MDTDSDPSAKLRDAPQAGSRRSSFALQQRRMSQLSIAGRRSIFGGRASIFGAFKGGFQKGVKFENTYRIAPKEEDRLKHKQLEELLQTTLENALKSELYDPKKAETLSMNLANLLRKRVKEMHSRTRYKIVTQVNIGPTKDTSLILASRALWHPEDSKDTFVEACYSNSSMFAVALLFCVYFE